MKKIILSTLMLSTMLMSSAFATKPKEARNTDFGVSGYEMRGDQLIRHFKNGVSCPIASNVHEFKISQHPLDAAVLYYIKNGDLYYLKAPSDANPRQCHKANTELLMPDIKKVDGKYRYGVIRSTNTKIVNVALDNSGKLLAWENRGKPVVTEYGIQDYNINQCNDKPGAAFQKFALFAKTHSDKVLKINGDNKKVSREDFSRSLAAFKEERGVCKMQKQHHRHAEYQGNDFSYDSALSAQ